MISAEEHPFATDLALLKSAQAAQKAELQETRLHMERQAEDLRTQLAAGMQELQRALSALASDFQASRKANWTEYRGWIFGIISVLSIMVTISSGVIIFYVNSSVDPVRRATESSAQDRQALRERIDALSMVQGHLAERATKAEAALVEVETQFCSLSDQINLRFINDRRLLFLLWQRVYGQDFPGEFFTPRVGRCG